MHSEENERSDRCKYVFRRLTILSLKGSCNTKMSFNISIAGTIFQWHANSNITVIKRYAKSPLDVSTIQSRG